MLSFVQLTLPKPLIELIIELLLKNFYRLELENLLCLLFVAFLWIGHKTLNSVVISQLLGMLLVAFPQGTRLGPILFIVLVNDASSDCPWRWKYVDDLTLGQVVKYGEHSNMQHHLNNLSDWCKQNDVLPKPAKCQSMIISFFKRQVPPVSFSMDSVNLTCISHIKLLGVTIQNDFKWNLHVDDIVSRASRKL